MGNPKVRVTLLAVSLAVAAAAAARHSQKRKSVQVQAVEKPEDPLEPPPPMQQKDTVPDPGVIFLGLAGLMIDAMSNSSKKSQSSRISASIVEAEPAEQDSVGFDDNPRPIQVTNAKKYDLFVELVNAGNDIVTDAKYDPIRSTLAEASKSVTSFTRSFISSIEWQGDDRYDLIKDLFTSLRAKGFSDDPKYDPLYRALKIDPPSGYKRFDPLGGIVRVARAPVDFVTNKFDFLVGFFKGRWQTDNQKLDDLPEWDPISKVHSAAGQPLALGDSKYDPAVTANRRGWLETNSSVRDAPQWDPVSGVQQAARRPVDFNANSYDITEAILQGEWLKTGGSLSDLPSWDPASELVAIAKGTQQAPSPSKYDAIPSLLYGKWRWAWGDDSWEEETKAPAQVEEVAAIEKDACIEEEDEEEEDVGDQVSQALEINDNAQGEATMESTAVEQTLKSQDDLDAEAAEEALMKQLHEDEAQEAARLEAEIAKIASERVAERIVSSKLDADSDKAQMRAQTKALESKTRVLKSIAALIQEFESVQRMDVLKT